MMWTFLSAGAVVNPGSCISSLLFRGRKTRAKYGYIPSSEIHWSLVSMEKDVESGGGSENPLGKWHLDQALTDARTSQ